MEGQPSRPPARGTRTLGRCSFDARNRGSTRPPLKCIGGLERTRAVEDQSAPTLERKRANFEGAFVASLDGRTETSAGAIPMER